MNIHEARLERCDRCGAAAKFEVLVKPKQKLLFCHHHANEHGKVLDTKYPILPVASR